MMCLCKTECVLFLCFLKVFTITDHEVCHILGLDIKDS